VTVAPQSPPLAKPVISNARLTHRRFRVAKGGTAVTARKHKLPPKGTTFVFTLSLPASIKIVITSSAHGLRSGKKCVAPTRKLRKHHAKRCTRTVTHGTLKRSHEAQGTDKLAFTGRIGHKALKPGKYKATLTATNTAGTSKAVTLKFKIVS
jgi:hypothetical protein